MSRCRIRAVRVCRTTQRGFVLAATVWVLAALVLLADYVGGVVAADRERARALKMSLQDELDARGTEATVLYLLATGRMNYRGLEVASATGRDVLPVASEPHKGLGRIRFSLQDEAGLASFNAPNVLFQAVLRHAGAAPADIALLNARIGDYIDRDDNLSLGGAERADYAAAGLPPPANWFFVAPLELMKVHDAQAVIPRQAWGFLRRTTTAAFTHAVNFNAMPVELLTAFLGGDAAAAARVAAYREQQPLTSFGVMSDAAGHDLSAYREFPGVMVASRLRIALWREGARERMLVGVFLTPGAAGGPWRTEYRYLEPAVGGSESARALTTPLFQPT